MDTTISNSLELDENIGLLSEQRFDRRMNIAKVWKLDTDYVVNSKFNREYSIVYHRNNIDRNINNRIIPVKSRREIELLLLSLGNEVNVIMNEQERRLCNIWDWLYGRTYSDIFTDLKWSYQEEEEVIDILERIPLPKTHFKINYNDQEPERIAKEFVHKHNQENVLISKPYKSGNMYYFNGLNRSKEFNIDHSSDHLEGIIIFEAARQAGIASAHLTGIPFCGVIVILKSKTRYTKFVEDHDPYIIRTIPIIKQRGGYSTVVYNVIQNGHSCAAGYVTGMIYKTKEAYHKFRNAQ